MGEEQRNLEAEAGAMEGGRRPTGVAPAGGATRGGLAPGQRWSVARNGKWCFGCCAASPWRGCRGNWG